MLEEKKVNGKRKRKNGHENGQGYKPFVVFGQIAEGLNGTGENIAGIAGSVSGMLGTIAQDAKKVRWAVAEALADTISEAIHTAKEARHSFGQMAVEVIRRWLLEGKTLEKPVGRSNSRTASSTRKIPNRRMSSN